MPSANDYLFHVDRITRQALIQFKAVKGCEQHPEVLIDLQDSGAESRALYIAQDWIERERGWKPMLADVRDSIKRFLADAPKRECPECARTRSG